ncbi:glycosyl hydrolase family 61-domain-containing protein [Bipolaris maydis]|nr:glycoside hydrolase family 61 protein [Bipolaris maydis]KAJ5063208.1 glycosyl hydrolase family 61-domain-containing protein [Bipolaris maydis]KAJ6199473.1 glycosyl hydrolase family 61-domain-containing protein [Bipolaris maydis]
MYKSLASTITAIAALAATASAHGSLTGVSLNGVFKQGYLIEYYYAMQQGAKVPEHLGWYAENLDNGFVDPSSYGTGDIICHKAGSPKGSSDTMGSIPAGGKIDFHWSTWPTSHVGPVLTYAAAYTGDLQAVKKEDLKWFKIEGAGYENGEWAANKLIANNNTWSMTIPENLAPSKYVFRHEIIALHAAAQENGAQNYPQCVNIEVTGSGTEKPDGVVGTKLYTPTDPGIKFDVYQGNLNSYVVPGPPAMAAGSGSGSGSGSTPAPSSTPSSAPSSPSPSTSAPSPSASAPAASVTPEAQEPTPSAAPSSGNLPETFTLDTFITWLEGKASSSASKARRHARAFL